LKAVLSLVCALPLLPLEVAAQSGAVAWHRISGGGGSSQNAGWQMSGFIGASAGMVGGGSFGTVPWESSLVVAIAPPVKSTAPVTSGLFGPTGAVLPATGGMTLNFTGQAGVKYAIQRSTNLTDWVAVWTTNAPSDGAFKYTDTFAGFGGVPPSSVFYRLLWNTP